MANLNKEIKNVIQVNNSLEGMFKFEAVKIDENGEEKSRVLADWFHNVITDQGLDWIGKAGYYSAVGKYLYVINGVQVGTGSTPESTSDTTLESVVATTATVQTSAATTGNSTTAPYWVQCQITWRFGLGVAAGNLSEVGTTGGYGNASNSSGVFSRTLIKDSTGTPVTITVESDEYLDVTYALRIYPTGSTGTFTQTIYGVSTEYTYTTLPAAISTFTLNPNRWSLSNSNIFNSTNIWFISGNNQVWYTGAIGTVTGTPAGTSLSIPTTSASTISDYVDGSHYIDTTMHYGLNDSNGSNQSCLMQLNMGCFQLQLTPAMTKTSNDTWSFTFRMSWGRYSG